MTILTYHRIIKADKDLPHKNLCVSPESFSSHIELLLKLRYNIISLDKYHEFLINDLSLKNNVVLTFDDGTVDLYKNAFPIIKKFQIPATFFVSTNPLQNLPLKSKVHPESDKYLNKSQILELHKGGIQIGSHSRSHRRLSRMPIDTARDEISVSKKILEDILGCEVKWFCYPYGDWNPLLVEIVKNEGYSGACSVIRDNQNTKDYIYFLKRVMVMEDTNYLRFRYFFTPFYHYLHKWKNKKRWGKFLGRLSYGKDTKD